MVATIKDPMDDAAEEGSNAGDESSDEENLSDGGFETVNGNGKFDSTEAKRVRRDG